MTLLALAFYFNFCMGALVPIVPRFAPEHAGWAFTAFSLFKVFFLVPAGFISDRIGHAWAVAFALVLQIVALVVIAAMPSEPWLGRLFEGAALAQGTLSTLSLFRVKTSSLGDFGKWTQRLLGVGSLGFLFGPMAGYLSLGSTAVSPVRLLLGLAVVGGLALLVHARDAAASVMRATEDPKHAPSGANMLWLGIALASAKVVGVGWQPLLGWWANHEIGLRPALAGLSFVLVGVAFGVGATQLKRAPALLVGAAVVLGLALLERAIATGSMLWWPAIVLVSAWFGDFLTRVMSLLGWNDPARIGRTNARWLAITDLPMALTPAVVWPMREASHWPARVGIAGVALALAIGAFAYGTRSREKTRNIQGRA